MEDSIKRVMSDVLGVPVPAITGGASPDTIPTWDSLGHMNLCMALEEEFRVHFNDRQVVNMMSYDAIVQTLAQLGAR
jgi:acyl carrier protein